MYDISIPVTAKAIDQNKRIVIEWPGYSSPTTVEWVFAPQADGTTFVTITEAGWTQGLPRARHQTESRGRPLS
jgi:uncharacterized protein YndB with AHSA1/START domain